MRVPLAILTVVTFASAPLAVADAPEAPLAVQVVAVGDVVSLISWSPVPGADFYRVYRGLSPDDMEHVGTTRAPHFVDAFVPRYIYGVVSVQDGVESPLVTSAASTGEDCVTANSQLHVEVTVANCVRN